MILFSKVIVLLWTFHMTNCNLVLLPVQESGLDVALIIISARNFTYVQYELLGLEIQKTSNERLWVQLSDGEHKDNSTLILEDAIDQLNENGFPTEGTIIASGHGHGADIAVEEALQLTGVVRAAIIIGRYGSHDRNSFPLPVLTINGDLDGHARITKTAKSFSYVKLKLENGEGDERLRYPHVVLEGVNHAQFCTGQLPDYAIQLWIEPEASDEESRVLLAESMDPYITYYSTQNETLLEQAQEKLLSYYNTTEMSLEPVFVAFEAEESVTSDTSAWAEHAQFILADLDQDLVHRLLVNNTVVDKETLEGTRPEIYDVENDVIFVTTYASIDRPIMTLYQAAAMIEAKFKSSGAILEALSGVGGHVKTSSGGIQMNNMTLQCKDVNQVAFVWVWNDLVPEKQKQRYRSRNVTITFLDDVFAVSGPQWIDSELLFDFDGSYLDIQSTNLISGTDFIVGQVSGMHYCKLLSPAKALEFIYVDSLYEYYYDEFVK